ncbi:MBL fold metallo-hydrolase [Pseudoalteromonas sp. T1lg23B]|uniref:MBL fold metallo-hydrolase n=1 Tax=Pseudoalteromonas sp. T1lg23B TaxID=2077097 RepID=UPI000CF5F1E4|nr:MBL fold metallo-hydrolase [Pseudoalteromonas sp. T1lg23B]
MRVKLLLVAVFYSACALCGTANFQVTSVSNSAFIITEKDYGTNIGLIKTKAGVVAIDPMPGEKNLDKLYQVIQQHSKAPVRYVLNTHQHGDHIGGNAYFVERGSKVVATVSDLPEIIEFELKSHTSKDKVFYHRESNSVFVGDIYDTSWHPTFYAGGLSGFNQAIEKILSIGDEDSLIIPGHGKPTSKVELRQFRKNTIAWVDKIKVLKGKGMSVEEITNEDSIKTLLHNFNIANKQDFIPENAFKRFIERTFTVIDSGK